MFATREDDCYCARNSYTTLIFGCTALLWAFGPGVVLPFMREKYRLEKSRLCPRCGYGLHGTIAAGRGGCPECGASIRPAP